MFGSKLFWTSTLATIGVLVATVVAPLTLAAIVIAGAYL